MTKEWMKPDEFVRLALSILGDNERYEDDKISIRRDVPGLDLEIERKPMPEIAPELSGTNPVTMVMKGEIIRHHGEHCYLVTHMLELDLMRNKILD